MVGALGVVSVSERSELPGDKHELWCMMGTPSLGTLGAADGVGLVAFCASFCALPVGVAILVELEVVRDFEDRE